MKNYEKKIKLGNLTLIYLDWFEITKFLSFGAGISFMLMLEALIVTIKPPEWIDINIYIKILFVATCFTTSFILSYLVDKIRDETK